MKYYTNERSQQIVLALLKANGIRKVVASPGTTNVTLVGSMQNDPWFEMYSSPDERAAAYIAVGLAAESGEPVVLTCTGATASRNYLSGLTEAFYRKLPILAITANQGREKVGHLIAQNIDRSSCQRDVVRMSVNIPKCKDEEDEWNATVLANKAILELRRNGGGPVHIDLSTYYDSDFSVKELPPVRMMRRFQLSDELPEMEQGATIGVFVGSHAKWTIPQVEALESFCSTRNAVVICDHTSGYKGRFRVNLSLLAGQKMYRSDLLKFDLIIHIGEVSGDYYSLKIKPKQVWRVSPDGEIRDTFRKLTNVFEMSEEEFFKAYKGDKQQEATLWSVLQSECRQMYGKLPELPFSNAWIAQYLSERLPSDSVIHLGILNSLRSWNFFEIPDSVFSYSNVGGFGIDGVFSTLMGAALADKSRIFYGVMGDLAFFYDMNVAGNRHMPSNVRVLMINNGRGVEFRNYGHICHSWGEDADKFMAASGHYGFRSKELVRHYAEDLGFEYISASDKEEFRSASERFLSDRLLDKPMIFEVFTDEIQESEALEMILNSWVDEGRAMKMKIEGMVKGTVGEKNFNKLKKILK